MFRLAPAEVGVTPSFRRALARMSYRSSGLQTGVFLRAFGSPTPPWRAALLLLEELPAQTTQTAECLRLRAELDELFGDGVELVAEEGLS